MPMMSIKRIFIHWFIILSGAIPAFLTQGIEISANISDGQLRAKVSDINYPTSLLEKELTSGLPNDISLLISLYQQDNKRFSASVNYQITYDLWDEIYTVHITGSNGLNTTIAVESKDKIIAYINEIVLPVGFEINNINTDASVQFKAQVLVNPVKTERIKKIKAWIATSQGYTPDLEQDTVKLAVVPLNSASGNSLPLVNPSNKPRITSADNVNSARPRFQKLFDQILEQYMISDEVPALWRSDVAIINVNSTKVSNEQ